MSKAKAYMMFNVIENIKVGTTGICAEWGKGATCRASAELMWVLENYIMRSSIERKLVNFADI